MDENTSFTVIFEVIFNICDVQTSIMRCSKTNNCSKNIIKFRLSSKVLLTIEHWCKTLRGSFALEEMRNN